MNKSKKSYRKTWTVDTMWAAPADPAPSPVVIPYPFRWMVPSNLSGRSIRNIHTYVRNSRRGLRSCWLAYTRQLIQRDRLLWRNTVKLTHTPLTVQPEAPAFTTRWPGSHPLAQFQEGLSGRARWTLRIQGQQQLFLEFSGEWGTALSASESPLNWQSQVALPRDSVIKACMAILSLLSLHIWPKGL